MGSARGDVVGVRLLGGGGGSGCGVDELVGLRTDHQLHQDRHHPHQVHAPGTRHPKDLSIMLHWRYRLLNY